MLFTNLPGIRYKYQVNLSCTASCLQGGLHGHVEWLFKETEFRMKLEVRSDEGLTRETSAS